MSNFRLFRYSRWGAVPALCAVGLVALTFGSVFAFAALPWWAVGLCFVTLAVGVCWNLQCLSHNFIHNPYFAWNGFNRLYSVLETLAIGLPHVSYKHYHLNHHKGDNDRKGPDGTTKDWSSIYRHSRTDAPESFWRYVLLGYWRVELGPLFLTVWRRGPKEVAQAVAEALALAAFWGAMAWWDWRVFLFFYLPSNYVGWMMSYAEGYFEHYGATPGNPYANSVSSYNRLYNFLWFNNGYDQEHHWDPKRHWTAMPALHEEFKGELAKNGTRTLRVPHFFAFMERYWWQKDEPAPAGGDRRAAA